MKKLKLLTSVLVASTMLCACDENTNNSNTTTPPSVEQSIKHSETESIEDNSALSELYSNIDWNTMDKLIATALYKMGVKGDDILSTDVENITASTDQLDFSYIIKTKYMELKADIFYSKLTESWCIVWISNTENQHIYYIDSSLEGTMDLYQYPSDKLICKATSNLEQHSNELETVWESLEEENNAEISSIADEYGIN